MHHNLTARRREHVRHIGRIRAIAQATPLEQLRATVATIQRIWRMTLSDQDTRTCITETIRTIRVQVDLGEAMPATGADAFDDDANAFVALRLKTIRARQIDGTATTKQEGVARTAKRVHVSFILWHMRADEAPIAVALVIRFDGLTVLQEVDELVAQLETKWPV